jgi:putative flippase GtrA
MDYLNKLISNKKELKSLASYIIIGLFTTLITWLIWTFLFYISTDLNIDKEIRFSASQFIASFSTITLSFYLNRIFTFKDKARRHKRKRVTVLNAVMIYLISPLAASLLTLIIQLILPGIFMDEILKIIGLATGMVINYTGQKFWIYRY